MTNILLAMRILHIVTAFPRQADDPIAPWLVELLTRLRARGHEIDVLASSYRGLGDHDHRGLRVHRFRYFPERWERLTHEETAPDRMRRSPLYAVMPLFFIVGGMRRAWQLTRRERYDIIHVHWPMPMALLGWAARRARRTPMVTTFYGIELRWVQSRLPFLRWLIRWAARASAQAVAISTYTARELRKFADVPIEVIPYTAELAPPSSPPLDARGAERSVLFVGRLIERKGVGHLIRALGTVRRQTAVRLVLIGDGPERPRLEQLARDAGVAAHVDFRGRVTDEELRRSYAAADVFVLPSVFDARQDTEGLGVVLLEAMNYAVPVIASDIGGITDIVQHEHTGLLVAPGDETALANALTRVLADPSLARTLGESGRRLLRETFSWDRIVDRWESVYERAAATAREPS
ncbi:MAG: glycosyltransferase family 4 protein [Cytophagaceae bacterium]|nr:glycosyltransferase family 4 protein [Gemmatimonadaceae bacterium]